MFVQTSFFGANMFNVSFEFPGFFCDPDSSQVELDWVDVCLQKQRGPNGVETRTDVFVSSSIRVWKMFV